MSKRMSMAALIMLCLSFFTVASWANGTNLPFYNEGYSSESPQTQVTGLITCGACIVGLKAVAVAGSKAPDIAIFLGNEACPKLEKYVHISVATCRSALDDIAALIHSASSLSPHQICKNDLHLC